MTQGDRIRSMSDKELAEFINNIDDADCLLCVGRCENNETCKSGYIKWLQSEAKEQK